MGEGLKRGLPLSRIAELTSTAPAQRFGLGATKGDLAPWFDADIALVDPDRSWTVDPADSESTQEYTPFRGWRSAPPSPARSCADGRSTPTGGGGGAVGSLPVATHRTLAGPFGGDQVRPDGRWFCSNVCSILES
ncbi:hypothetical protein Acsp07_10370 [Actinomycetospora sp. NBRC 106378]|nr:hypothetical protein Acsp07_10370 [Actinomycetospora sp. NBRC 106378]